ncbi:MAG: hypothetical protein HYX75_08380 [Acidobacteria bacterium]|nr:hypothetical protein [Acidobacteriota bacterium]
MSLLKMAAMGVPVILLAQGSEGQSNPVSIATAYSESFETGMGGWMPDHHLACEPACWPLSWHIVRSPTRAYHGAYSLDCYLNGDHDDGTIWVERPFQTSALAPGSYKVSLLFYLWSDSYSHVNRWPVVAFLGSADPEREDQFAIIGQTNMVAGWKQYSYSRVVSLKPTQALWVAFGFGATWEVPRTYAMDMVRITVEPARARRAQPTRHHER